MAIHRKAIRIARETSVKNELIQRELFLDVTKMLLKMASINFIKAVVETGYMNEFYKSNDYSALESSINKNSEDLT